MSKEMNHTEAHYISEELKEIVEAEGDEKVFDYRGVHCEITRANKSFSGHLCGYVTRPDFITSDDMNAKMPHIDVHGGWTYHNDDVWGFDCAHAWDIAPLTILDELNICDLPDFFMSEYRTMPYVESQLKQAVDKLIDGVVNEDD